MPPDRLVGTRLREYEITEEIGKGGMGTVYKARHIYLHKERAIKVIHSIFAEDAHLRDRFIREAKILSELDHPNLVRLYEFGQLDENTFFMVQEYVPGESIYHRMKRVGTIPLEDSIRMIRQAAIGLGSAHRKSIIHRDISPDNLMLTLKDSDNEIVKVIDFGIAKPLMAGTAQFTATHAFIGKAEYCSPEQTGLLENSAEIDHRTDIYSLAVTLYYMLIGKLPFFSPTPVGYLFKHANEPPVPLLTHDSSGHFPAALDRLILKALSKQIEERHSSMEEFVEELDQISQPDDFVKLFETGRQHYDRNEPHQALAYWHRALQLSPDDENLKQWIQNAERQRSTIVQPQVADSQSIRPSTPSPPPVPFVAETAARKSGSRMVLLVSVLLGLFLIATAILVWRTISNGKLPMVDLHHESKGAGSEKDPAIIHPGKIYKVLLRKDQEYFLKASLSAGQYRITEDTTRADRQFSNLISSLKVLFPERSAAEVLFNFNEVDVTFRKTHRFSLTAPGELAFTLKNLYNDAEFFLTIQKSSDDRIVPFANQQPVSLKPGETITGTLDQYQSAYYILHLKNGDYVAEWQFTNSEQRNTNLQGYLAVLESDGGNQRQISMMNEVDVTHKQPATIRVRNNLPVILRLQNSIYSVDYSLRVNPL